MKSFQIYGFKGTIILGLCVGILINYLNKKFQAKEQSIKN